MKGQESRPFEIISSFQPCGDQPGAIRELSRGIRENGPARRSWESPARARPSRLRT